MTMIEEIYINGYEKVIHATEDSTGLDCYIAIHSTELGPAFGGARFWKYEKSHDAMEDVLRLAKGMTYKNSLAGLNLGGGKAVINLRNAEKTPKLLEEFGKVVDTLEGDYITADDVGANDNDMKSIHKVTEHVAFLDIDPSPATSLGVVRGMQAALTFLRNDFVGNIHCLEDVHIAIQGLGHVGFNLAEMLYEKGAKLTVADIDPWKCTEAAHKVGAIVVSANSILELSLIHI